MNTARCKACRTLVIDCDLKYLVALRHLLMAKAGVRPGILLIRSGDSLASVTIKIRCFKPDLLIASEKYFGFWLSDILKEVGYPFYLPDPKADNPRMIFTSMFPSKEILALAGTHFKRKYDLVRGDPLLRQEAEALFCEAVSASLLRIREGH